MVLGIFVFSTESKSEEDLSKAFESSFAAESEGRIDEAYSIIERAMGKGNYESLMRLAYLRALAGRYKESAELYAKAAELEGNAVEPLLYEQYQYFLLEDWVRLEEVCLKTLKIDANNYISRTRLAYSYYMRAQYSKAAEEYSKVQLLYPLDLDVMLMRGWSYALSNRDNLAFKIFRKVLMLSPSNTSAKEGLEFLKKNKG